MKSAPRNLSSNVRWILICLAVLLSSACWGSSRDRPPGYIRLGPVRDFTQAITYFDRSAFVLRFDGKGFWVMSTLSTTDLTRLERKDSAEGDRWYASNDHSVFAEDGTVLQGPATQALPYYKVVLDEGAFRGPKDTLYVAVGSKRPKDWRLEVAPGLLETQAPPLQATAPPDEPLQP